MNTVHRPTSCLETVGQHLSTRSYATIRVTFGVLHPFVTSLGALSGRSFLLACKPKTRQRLTLSFF